MVQPYSANASSFRNIDNGVHELTAIDAGRRGPAALIAPRPEKVATPVCALAAIVISAVTGLVDYEEAIFLWGIDKKDFFLWAITFITTLIFGIEIGVLVGVGFSLAFVIHESANPHIAVLGRLPGTTVYRNTLQYPEAYTYNGIVVIRIDAPIYFANISYIKDRLREYELNLPNSNRGLDVGRVYFVILEMSPVTYVDSSAVQALKDLHQEYKARHIQIAIANPNRQVHLLLSRSGIIDLIGDGWCFVRVHDAMQVCLQHVHNSSSSALKLASQASGDSADSISTPKSEQQRLKQDGFFINLWKAQDGNAADSGGEVQPLLRQNLV
uniref:STAS domain-containing protein n=1 Tax=Setaria italica TaxID=4555 RepID=K3ZV80_SETIT